jgi:hypothetical protein
METIELTKPQIYTLIEILQEDCVASAPEDIDFSDPDYMEFLAIRAGILQILKNKEVYFND